MIIAFDLGQVIFHVKLQDFLNDLVCDGLFTNYQKAYEFLESIQVEQDLGKVAMFQACQNYLFSGQFDPVVFGIVRKWKNVINPSIPMIQYIFSLLKQGHKIALLSNIGTDHAAIIKRDYNFVKECITHFSCEVGYRKPDPKFFSSFIELNNIENPNEILFFDDRPENIAACGPLRGINFNLADFYTEEMAVGFVQKMIESAKSGNLT